MIEEYEFFLKMDTTPYMGEWIAICGREVVAHSKSLKETYTEAKKVCGDKEPWMAAVPPEGTLLL